MKPYAPLPLPNHAFRLPDGSMGWMNEEISMDNGLRYREEVKLIQMALGVKPDGIIGPETRTAAKAIWEQKN